MRKTRASRNSRHGGVLEFGLLATLLTAALMLPVQGIGAHVIGGLSDMVANLRAS